MIFKIPFVIELSLCGKESVVCANTDIRLYRRAGEPGLEGFSPIESAFEAISRTKFLDSSAVYTLCSGLLSDTQIKILNKNMLWVMTTTLTSGMMTDLVVVVQRIRIISFVSD